MSCVGCGYPAIASLLPMGAQDDIAACVDRIRRGLQNHKVEAPFHIAGGREGLGDRSVNVGANQRATWDADADEALSDALALLGKYRHVEDQRTPGDLRSLVVRSIHDSGPEANLKRLAGKLIAAFQEMAEASLVISAVGGAQMIGESVLLSPHVVVGRLGSDFESKCTSAIAERGVHNDRHRPAPLSHDVLESLAWTEDYLCMVEDPDADLEDPWLPVCIATTVPARGLMAVRLAEQRMRELLSAAWLGHRHKRDHDWPAEIRRPWLIGDRGWSTDPDRERLLYSEDSEGPEFAIYDINEGSSSYFSYSHVVVPVDLDAVLNGGFKHVVRTVASSSYPRCDSWVVQRVAAACGQVAGSSSILDFTIAMEALVPDLDTKNARQRFVTAIQSLSDGAATAGELRDIYDLRSDFAHSARTDATQKHIEERGSSLETMLATCLKKVADLHVNEGVASQEELQEWVSRTGSRL